MCVSIIVNKSKLIVREKTNMKNLSMKTLITYSIALIGLFGIVRAEEAVVTETTQPVVSVTGELSTDITFGDATTFASPYTGLVFSGDGWVVSTNLSDGMVHIEEAKYSWLSLIHISEPTRPY